MISNSSHMNMPDAWMTAKSLFLSPHSQSFLYGGRVPKSRTCRGYYQCCVAPLARNPRSSGSYLWAKGNNRLIPHRTVQLLISTMKLVNFGLSIVLMSVSVLGGFGLSELMTTQATRANSPQIQFFSQAITFAFSQSTPTTPCGQLGSPFSMWNFTENLAGRDPGSTFVFFKYHMAPQELFLFHRSDINQQLANSFGCPAGSNGTPPIPLWHQEDLFDSGVCLCVWRPMVSGGYTALMVQGSPNSLFPLMANETWTLTTTS